MPTLPIKKSNEYTKLEDGLALVKYRIESITDYSNPPGKELHTVGKKGFKPELCLIVKLSNSKYSYDKYLFGNYQWKEDKVSGKKLEATGWLLKRNSVYDFLSEIADEDIQLNDDFTIQKTFLDKLIGKYVYILKYNGKNGLEDFWLIKPATEKGKMELLTAYEKYQNKSGKPKSSNTSNSTDDEVPF